MAADHRFAAHQVTEAVAGHRGVDVAVIDLVRRRGGQGQHAGGDVRRHRLAVGQAVVAGDAAVGAVGQTGAGHRHQVGVQHVLVVERRGASRCHRFRVDQAGRDAQCRVCRGIAVVDLVGCGHRRRQRLRRDVRRHRLAGGQTVVAGNTAVGAVGQTGAGHRHQVGVQHVLVVERRGASRCHRFRVDQAGRDAQCRVRRGVAVVDLVGCCDGRRQRFRRDVRRRRGAVRHIVVAGDTAVVAVGQGDAADADRVGRQYILAVEGGHTVATNHRFAAHQVTEAVAGHCGVGVAVIDFIRGDSAQRHRLGRDARRGVVGMLVQCVVTHFIASQN